MGSAHSQEFDQIDFLRKFEKISLCSKHRVSDLSSLRTKIELTLGHLRYHLTDVPPQPNSPPDYVFRTDQPSRETTLKPKLTVMQASVQRNK